LIWPARFSFILLVYNWQAVLASAPSHGLFSLNTANHLFVLFITILARRHPSGFAICAGLGKLLNAICTVAKARQDARIVLDEIVGCALFSETWRAGASGLL
jgi:hypothetical protein